MRLDAKTIVPTAVLVLGASAATLVPSPSPARARAGAIVRHFERAEQPQAPAAEEPAGKRNDDKRKTAEPAPAQPVPAEPAPAPAVPRGAEALAGLQAPLFLLPIYRAAARRHGIRWEVLAAINEIESDYGRNVSVSSAGAEGWMQFMPQTWADYGVDANRDGRRDPYNPVDAIFAAARYLEAAGYRDDVRAALWAYNHADWYVDDVLRRANRMSGLPARLATSLSDLGAGRFPVRASRGLGGSSRARTEIRADEGATVVAVGDGRVTEVSSQGRLGYRVVLEDHDGNQYGYRGLASVRRRGPARIRGGFGGYRSDAERLRRGDEVTAGEAIGTVGRPEHDKGPHIDFSLRTGSGRRARRVGAAPLLDAWERLEQAFGARDWSLDLEAPEARKALQMPRSKLAREVLRDPRIEIYEAGTDDVRAGRIDRRVLATLAWLADAGLKPTVTSLHSGHSRLTSSGNVSNHWYGRAVDIAALNGVPVLGNQQRGGLADRAVRLLLELEGEMRPAELISLFSYGGPSFAMADHADHIHVGFGPASRDGAGPLALPPSGSAGNRRLPALLERLGRAEQPRVRARRR